MTSVVIMAGGRGERFWPKSRVGRPKQFTDLTGKGTMLYLTYQRMLGVTSCDRIFVVTDAKYQDLIIENLPELPAENIIIEPEGRNTAPCIGLAALILEKRYPGTVMVVVPADQLIEEEEKFTDTLATAIDLAVTTGGLVTMGIRPTRPETGYGYLRTGEHVPLSSGRSAYKVSRFVEKPDQKRAQYFFEDGSYLWNSGMFVWKTTTILEAFHHHLPAVYAGLLTISQSLDTDNYPEVLGQIYPSLQKVSIDYGIMEKAALVYTVPGDFGWDDVGTWKALERIFGTDRGGNVLRGQALALKTKNTVIDCGDRLIAVIGAEDLIIVDTEDITFICQKNETDLVRELLEELRSRKMEKYL